MVYTESVCIDWLKFNVNVKTNELQVCKEVEQLNRGPSKIKSSHWLMTLSNE